jgi:hypothetical protein
MIQGGFIRFALFLVLGVFLWAGTVSIKYPQQSSTVTTSSAQTCAGKSDGEHLLEYLKMGTITSIQDNGRILTIGLSPEWANLPASVRQKAYGTVACYAQSQHRPFQFLAHP